MRISASAVRQTAKRIFCSHLSTTQCRTGERTSPKLFMSGSNTKIHFRVTYASTCTCTYFQTQSDMTYTTTKDVPVPLGSSDCLETKRRMQNGCRTRTTLVIMLAEWVLVGAPARKLRLRALPRASKPPKPVRWSKSTRRLQALCGGGSPSSLTLQALVRS